MTTIYVPRVFGGTLILTVTPPPPSNLATVLVVATFRDGNEAAGFRDGEAQATFRDGTTTGEAR